MCARECGCARRDSPSVSAGAGLFARVASRKQASAAELGLWPGEGGAAAGALLLLLFPLPGELKGDAPGWGGSQPGPGGPRGSRAAG